MNWESFISNTALLEAIKILLFVGMFLFSTNYLLPHGIIHCLKWKETGHISNLAKGINFISVAVFMLLYFLSMFVIDSIKKI